MVAALAAAAAVIPLTATAADAATTTKYNHATFLQHALGLPTSNTSPVIESITYDRFQWLLQQDGQFAFLIGDPAGDASFAERARAVEAAASSAGVKQVYWFNPNLSGSVKVGTVTVPALDIRKSETITELAADSRTTYGHAWKNLVGQYLGNGVTATATGVGSETAVVKTVTGTNTVNDYGATAGYSTEVGNVNGGALYDYKTATPADVTDSFFFVYDKANTVTPDGSTAQPAKVVSWVNLTDEASTAAAAADVNAAIGKVGPATLDELDQFAWWKSEVNARQKEQAPRVDRGSEVPVLTDADNAAADGGWRIQQVTYPELVDLLKSGTDANAVILFGGTWCPNTRPVLPFINEDAQEHDVTVFNFDTVLDGGQVGGSTTSAVNPFQSRNTANNGSTAALANANPTFLYGHVLQQYLNNIVTQYDPARGASQSVTFYPAGDTTKPLQTTKKLQVPFLLAHQAKAGDAPNGGITRQWIQKNAAGAVSEYTEYMSQWWFTNPKPNQLGISATQLPAGAPIWNKINADLATFNWKTDVSTVIPNTGIDTDDAQYLVDGDTATVSNTDTAVTVASPGTSPIPIGPTALAGALDWLTPARTPASSVAAKTAYLAAVKANTDATLITHLKTVVGAWHVAQLRKTTVLTAWGLPTTPGSVAGGKNLIRKLDVFFGGLPGGPRFTTRTVTANPVTAPTAPSVSVTIASAAGRTVTGNVAVSVKSGATEIASGAGALSGNAASVALPAIAAGTYQFTLTYAGDEDIDAFTESGRLTVNPAPVVEDPPAPVNVTPGSTPTPTPAPIVTPTAKAKVSKVAGTLSKAPTSKKSGKYTVTISTAKGQVKASGKVTIKFTKGKTTKTVTGTLKSGTVTVTVPKLAKGTWKVAITWPGDSKYQSGKATGKSIKVKK
ncbi:Ig-like domain-containing protein [Solirubrobacter pauli]|nr:Ig-like domain-containing protein [Solirubrobacter pauli]